MQSPVANEAEQALRLVLAGSEAAETTVTIKMRATTNNNDNDNEDEDVLSCHRGG
jgi:hypothetical protein